MKKFLMFLCAVLLTFAVVGGAWASTVNVWGERFDLNIVNNFYAGLTGHTSSIIYGTLDTNDLSGVDLLWAVQPSDSYTAAELSTMATFLSGGGRIAFMGEHGGYAPNENDRISAALSYLGSGMSIINLWPDGGFHNATVGNGQILPHTLTAGVNTYNYACFAPLAMGGASQVLMLGTNLSDVMMGYENIGLGSIFLITDQNVWDNVYSSSNDNNIMFENLLLAKTGAEPIPEPCTMILFGTGIVGAAGILKKRIKKS
ncbi:MAG: PEP-CTERM sorting domain-containing protein [Thermodesulfobacteriota bacterium]|nr:PEP-CTERM sorting domain-containing protein [Thermodesulfobacteriota bacterium]